jgi:hypothetical protein
MLRALIAAVEPAELAYTLLLIGSENQREQLGVRKFADGFDN